MRRFALLLLIIFLLFFLRKSFFKEKRVLGISAQTKIIILDDNGLSQSIKSNADSVANFLSEQQIRLSNYDLIYPNEQARLFSGMTIKIQRAKNVSILADKKNFEIHGFGNTVEEILQENNIDFKEEDIIKPSRKDFVYNNLKIEIIRVEIKEEVIKKKIKFKTIYKKDAQLSWRKKKTKQKGISGIKEIKYEIAYHNEKEVNRKIIGTNIIKKPVDEIIVQGTYVKLGKSHTGLASWYAYTGTMSAANPWLPMGSYVKVTNQDNGKSVIVKINDRGPFGNGRIIDLDKTAFAKIANLGQGTANIKMEEIIN